MSGPANFFDQVTQYFNAAAKFTTYPEGLLEQIRRCNDRGIPVVLYNRVVAGGNACSVGCDQVNANRDIADRLYRSGHRHFAFISGGESAPVSNQRELGFVGRLRELGVNEVAIALGDFGYESGHAAMLALLQGERRLTAVVAANDGMALGAMDAARYDCALDIPRDVLSGMVAGAHTQPAALAFAVEQTKSEAPNIGYATVFPLATIAKVLLAQLVFALSR